MPELAYLNGKVLAIQDAFVPIEDRGYQFGDAVYEVIPSYNGKMFKDKEHIKRMVYSLKQLRFPEVSEEYLYNELNLFFNKAKLKRASVYMQVSRGVYKRKHSLPDMENTSVQFVMTIRDITKEDVATAKKKKKGISVITVKDSRWGRCDIKTVQLLANSLAKQTALDAGVEDAVFISEDGIVREASSANMFIVKNGIIFTHPETFNILSGVTRSEIINIIKEKKLTLNEDFYTAEKLINAEEAFLTGSITEVMPVIFANGNRIGTGEPGKITKDIYASLCKRMTAPIE
ncbi:MAG: aminotransferase class IV [Deltaproteobacteria bacterium]|nr:aminotransferase class IV [Deltaproteobacteria bacterium]